MECNVCGFTLPENAIFCPGCGRKLSAAAENDTTAGPVKLPVAPEAPASPAPAAADMPPAPPAPESVTEEAAVEVPAEAPAKAPEEKSADPVPECAPVPEPVKRRQRPGLVPCLVMAGMMLVGLICFWLIPMGDSSVPGDTTPQAQEGPTLPPLPSGKDTPDRNDFPEATRPSGDLEAADERLFRLTAQGLEFIGSSYDSAVLVIPGEIDGKPVTAIADYGFAELDGVTTIVLPEALVSIGDHAFEDCGDLRGIYVPEGVHTIGESAFGQCINLEAVYIPGNVTRVGADAFDGCASLRYIFYDGTHIQWADLYDEYVTPFTFVICIDGDYYQGV